MGGKSQTCRYALTKKLRSMTAEKGSETRKTKGDAAGKSETCRASAWQSHYKRDPAVHKYLILKSETGRASAWQSHCRSHNQR